MGFTALAAPRAGNKQEMGLQGVKVSLDDPLPTSPRYSNGPLKAETLPTPVN